ncbi:MAG: hypothetical protein V3R66_01545 [Rhodospirillales bacterium]
MIGAVLSAAILSRAWAEQVFVSSITDLPLMAGLSEDADGGMVFDTPSGRIVDAYAHGWATRSQVLEFYSSTLPQLGWRPQGEAAFGREGEILKLEFPGVENSGPDAGPDTVLTVRFHLSPAN